MAEQDHTGRWRRLERAKTVPDAIELLRRSVLLIHRAPDDPEVRRQVRAVAAEHELWDQLAVLLADEARVYGDDPAIAAALYEELADVHHALDQPLESIRAMEALLAIAPDSFEHHERIAALYRQAGAWAKAADALIEEMDRLVTAPITARELQRAKNQFARDYVIGRQTVQGKASMLAHAVVLHKGDVGTADGEFDIFQKMTVEDVQRVARTYFTPQTRMVLTVMPRGQRPVGDE